MKSLSTISYSIYRDIGAVYVEYIPISSTSLAKLLFKKSLQFTQKRLNPEKVLKVRKKLYFRIIHEHLLFRDPNRCHKNKAL